MKATTGQMKKLSPSPQYEDEEEFEAATEDVTGDFGIGDEDFGGDDGDAW
jgi:transcription factor IIIB subunit 2